ncbi:MAG TPA: SAM-dependent methyltransferase, partial [Magnetospirillaceae bacterium]|nr:SAM-dependent methyltransferase [Magnetospirillaceae bacterium]
MNSPGRLYLIPAPIGGTDPLRSLPPETIAAMRGIRHFVVESERTAARLLSSVLSREALRETSFWILDEHTPANSIPGLLEPALAGQDIGLMSEVGCPCIADPGSGLVAEAHRLGMRVLPLAGPSSILMALMASGFNGQSFVFLGYLPARAEKRRATLKRIEGEARRDGSTRVFIETPYRNRVLLEDALKVLDGG